MEIKEWLSKFIPDDIYLKRIYKKHMGKNLDLKHPKTFNEKLQWLKLHDHNPIYIKLVDKYEVKYEVAKIIGDEYIIPTIGVWDKFEEINFDKLPDKFVLKTTHDSGSVIICNNKENFNLDNARIILEKSLKTNYYLKGREWPYKYVKPRIIAEKNLVSEKTDSIVDYKLFCFDGSVDNIMVVRERSEGTPQFFHFDKDWNLCRFNRLTRSLPKGYNETKPNFIDDMICIAEKLSKGIPHVRIDLYDVDGRIYFGEFTLYNQSGFETGFDDYSDNYLGGLITLPQKHT